MLFFCVGFMLCNHRWLLILYLCSLGVDVVAVIVVVGTHD